MAPEQTDTSIDKSLSRNTSVDVYSLGMLTYYVLSGNNPVPNEPLLSGFKEKTLNAIERNYKFDWKYLPYYLTETILSATAEKQTSRVSLDTFISNLQIAAKMQINHTITNTHPLLLLELSYRIDSQGREKISEFGRRVDIDYSEISKRISLATTSYRGLVVLNVNVERYLSNSDQRESVSKYFKVMCERAIAKVNKNLFSVTNYETSNTNISISLSAVLPDPISLEYIEELAKTILDVRIALDN